jgi:hypothetical protein
MERNWLLSDQLCMVVRLWRLAEEVQQQAKQLLSTIV